MISSWLSLLSLYAFSLFMFYSCNTLISTWILMEFNLLMFLLFIFFLESSNKDLYFKMGMFYFLVQSLGSMLFLGFIITGGDNMISEFFFVLSMMIKMGLFPFVFWVFILAPVMSSLTLFFFLVFQKIFYFLFFFTLFPISSLIICFLSLIAGTIMMFLNSNLDKFLISSSLASCFWVFFLFSQSNLSFFLFYVMYGLMLFSILFFKSTWSGISVNKSSSFWILSSLFLFLVGLPPFSLFFFKFDIVSMLMVESKSFEFLFFWLLSFLGLMSYFKMFYKNFISTYCMSKSGGSMNISILFLVIFLSPMWIM